MQLTSPALSVFVSMFYRLVYNVSFFIWALFLFERGFLATEVGIILGVNSLVSLAASLPSGFANDRFSSKHLLQFGALLFAIMMVIVLYTNNFWLVLFAFILSGIGHRLLDISIDSFVLKAEQKLEDKSILPWFILLRFVGIALGMIIGTTVLGIYSFTEVIYVSLFGLLVLLGLSFGLNDQVKVKLTFGDIWEDLKNPKVAFFLVGITIFALHFGAEAVAYAPFLQDRLGLIGWQIGAYMGSAVFIMGIAGFFFAKWLKKVPAGYFLVLGLLVSGVFHMAMIVENVTWSLLARIVHEIGDAAVFAFIYNGLSVLFPQKSLSSNFGILMFLMVIATGISTFVYGYIVEISTVAAPLFISGIVSVIVALAFIIGFAWFPKLKEKLF